MAQTLPALSLVAVPGRRHATLDIAREAERRGFTGLYVPSIFGNMAQCTALALATERIPLATAIAPIYARTVEDFAHSAAYIHEVSGGRFRFGIGVAHAPSHIRMGVTPGKPLADIRSFVAKFRAFPDSNYELCASNPQAIKFLSGMFLRIRTFLIRRDWVG